MTDHVLCCDCAKCLGGEAAPGDDQRDSRGRYKRGVAWYDEEQLEKWRRAAERRLTWRRARRARRVAS